MSKEQFTAQKCACGQMIQFMEYHWPHCSANPVNLTGKAKVHMASVFTKSELAVIATRGPMRDEPVRKLHGVGSRKRANAKPKR